MKRARERWSIWLVADRRRLGLLCGLLTVGLLFWGRLLLKDVPKVATAEPATAVSSGSPETGR